MEDYNRLVVLFMRGKATEKEKDALINILLKDMTIFLRHMNKYKNLILVKRGRKNGTK